MRQIDMSEKAVLRRLRQVDQLRELSLSLIKAKKLHDAKEQKGKVNGSSDSSRTSDKAR
jgi:hypothetical protein